MQVSISVDDFRSAPATVKAWLLQRLFGDDKIVAEGQPSKKSKSNTTDKVAVEERSPSEFKTDSTTKEKVVAPTVEEILERARALMEAKGNDALAAILKEFGIKNVKACPEDKRAELLARIAVDA